MKKHKSKVGKNLIGMLMFQMYGDSKLIYREYVQNARDAINDAVKDGILNKITDGHITVNIDSDNRTITIIDNGTGVSVDKVEPVLLDIADSDKDGETSAGQFGIGRLVGGYFCKKLTFKTSYKGTNDLPIVYQSRNKQGMPRGLDLRLSH
jgi:molecular chaperone HtpG